ncbi:DNA-binding domain-containing protein [Endozoicomonas arenosclerae]|uniref:HvfC/BufC N-terminal domain-containing protein n=1 Tax=Endozoicomonas arenosclerae TaxID=1633495 RepID=UPI0007820BBE|nr:DNA-binding domain-containing protein [Endozoicomonas arenosclerae]
MKLEALQKEMLSWIQSSQPDSAPECIQAASSLTPEQGLSVYRNSIHEIAIRALKLTFPVTHRVLGEECFRSVLSHYIRTADFSDHSLENLGQDLHEYVAQLPEFESLTYLPDLILLELRIHRCELEPAETAMTLEEIQSAIQLGIASQFHLSDSSSLLASDYPVLDIWQMHQEYSEPEMNLDEYPSSRVLITQQQNQAFCFALSPEEYALLSALSEQPDLEKCCELLTSRGQESSLSAFSNCMEQGFINRVT